MTHDPCLSVEHISALKARLILQKVLEISSPDDLISNFHDLHNSLLAQKGLDKSRTLAVDTLTIVILRLSQFGRFHPEKSLAEIDSHDLTTLFRFVCDFLQTGTGAFSNAVTALLGRILPFLKIWSSQIQQLVELWIEIVMDLPYTLKNLYTLLESISKEFSFAAQYVLQKFPDFLSQCINIFWSNALSNSASKAFVSIHSSTRDQFDSVESWIGSWSIHVMNGLENPGLRSNVVSHLLSILLKTTPEAFNAFVKSCLNYNDSDEWIDVLLGVLKVGQSIAVAQDPVENGTLAVETLTRFLTHQNETYRLNSLGLIASIIRSTSPTPKYVTDVLVDQCVLDIFFKECGSAESRSAVSSILRRSVITLKEALAHFSKKRKNSPDFEENVKVTFSTLQRIFDYSVSRILPDSTYSELSLSFDMLQVFVDQEFDGILRSSGKKKPSTNPTRVFDIFTAKTVQILLRFTTNNYEDIRGKAAALLLRCPPETLTEILATSSPEVLENSLDLLHSVKGRKSDGGAELFLTLAKFHQKNGNFDSYFDIINRLLFAMNDTIAAGNSPHGHFTALALIFESTNTSVFMAQKDYFSSTFASLMHTTNVMWDILKPKMRAAPSELDEAYDSISWRVVREGTALLSTILEINSKQKWVFFDHTTFLKSCDLIMDQLTNVTHRGAFSAVFPTYVRACEICFQTPQLSDVPRQWLETNLRLVETKTQYISRRSAGLPYLITGAVNAASSSHKLEEFMQYTFQELLRIASVDYVPNADEKMDLPQVHAFNCMKHIFSDSALSHGVHPHVNGALQLSLKNLTNPTWAIKNAAVMLFTSLQGRLFGSNKLGDILPCVSASLFFNKYPGVESILYDNLLLSVQGSKTVNSILPVLAVLSRLESFSASDETLAKFVVLLEEQFLSHKLWKVREMTAQLMASLVHPSRLIGQCRSILESVPTLNSRNAIHGRLHCVLEMVKKFHTKFTETDLDEDFVQSVCSGFSSMVSAQFYTWPILQTYLEIINLIHGGKLPQSTVNLLGNLMIERLENIPSFADGSRQLFLSSVATTLLCNYLHTEEFENLNDLSLLLLQSPDTFEVQLACIKFWQLNYIAMDLTEICTQLHEIINDPQGWAHVKASAIELLGAIELNLLIQPETILVVQDSWSDQMKASSLVPYGAYLSNVSDEVEVEKFISTLSKYLYNAQTEEIRMAAVSAAGVFSRSDVKNEHTAEAVFFLFKALFDDCLEIRTKAASALCVKLDIPLNRNPVFVAHKFVPAFIGIYSIPICSQILYQEISIKNNLEDLKLQLLSKLFDIDRTNMYCSEVQYQEAILEGIGILQGPMLAGPFTHIESNLCEEIDLLIKFIKENEKMLKTWTFEGHLDMAIRKVKMWGPIADRVKTTLEELEQQLKIVGYIF